MSAGAIASEASPASLPPSPVIFAAGMAGAPGGARPSAAPPGADAGGGVGGASNSVPPGPRRPTVVVVSGLSGAGKSTALRTLEDLGFFCTDNLPTILAPQAVALCEHGGMVRVALGIDVRVRAFLGEFGNVLAMLENGGQRDVQVIFLDASDDTILRRFSETRRPHPMNADGGAPSSREGAIAVLDGIHLERERLAPLRARATHVFDTTRLSVHELRRTILRHFGPASGGAPRMHTRMVSFGFKYGTPLDSDLVLDVRFLDNPYFVPELKNLPGTDPAVARYVMSLAETGELVKKTKDLLAYVMPKYEREGKSYLTIAIGCTGGRHRSVVLAEVLARDLQALTGNPITVVHRDVTRRDGWGTGPAGDTPDPRALPNPPPFPSLAPPPVPEGAGAERSLDDLPHDEGAAIGPPSMSAVERVGILDRGPR